MSQLSARFLGVLLTWVAFGGCASHAPRPAQNSATVSSAPPNPRFPDGPAQRLRSHHLDFPVELALPGRDSWRITDGPHWLVAEHTPSSSQFAFRTWRADRLVRRADCEAQARLARPTLPVIHEEAVLERRTLPTPTGFDTELVVGVEPGAHGISGYAVAIGADVGRCYAAAFTTAVSGGEAEQEVAARLGLVVDRVLGGVRVRSVDERGAGVRRRLVSTPHAPPE